MSASHSQEQLSVEEGGPYLINGKLDNQMTTTDNPENGQYATSTIDNNSTHKAHANIISGKDRFDQGATYDRNDSETQQDYHEGDGDGDDEDDDDLTSIGSGASTPTSTISTTESIGDHHIGIPLPPPRRPSRIFEQELLLGSVRESSWRPWLRKRVPAFGWLISPGYNVKQLPDDVIAGITISTVVIPQSMAYAMLAPLPPVFGLYTSVVPIIIHSLLTSSKHMHTGTFAITSLLLGQAVRSLLAKEGIIPTNHPQTLQTDHYMPSILTSLFSTERSGFGTMSVLSDIDYEQRFIAMILMLSFTVGLLQVLMSGLRVGHWASKNLLPDALVSGFNTAAVFYIGTSQLKHFLGVVKMPSPQGAFALIKTLIWIVAHFTEATNWYTLGLGSLAILFLVLVRKLEQRRKKKWELELRRKEVQQVQQRQAETLAAFAQNQKRGQVQLNRRQDQWQPHEQQDQRRHPLTVSEASGRTLIESSPTSPSTPPHEALPHRPSITFVDNNHASRVIPSSQTESDAEQALDQQLEDLSRSESKSEVYIPIPDILLCVVLFTVMNVLFSLESKFGIVVIGPIPTGLPNVAFPPSLVVPGGAQEWMTSEFLWKVVVPMLQPAALIAVIVYVMSYSIAKQFGHRFGYEVDADQEMLALGMASMGGSCFSGYACTGSLTRTAILAQSGAQTPLASLIGVLTVVLTLICLTWCFEPVPNAVLAAVVLVALQSLVMQIGEPFKLWREGQHRQAIIWTTTFLTVLIVSVEIGIAVGVVTVLLGHLYGFVYGQNGNNVQTEENVQSGLIPPSRGNSYSSLFSGSNNGPAERRRRKSRRRSSQIGSNGGLFGRWLAKQTTASPAGTIDFRTGESVSSRWKAWKHSFWASNFGQRFGALVGREQPILLASTSSQSLLHNHVDDEDY